MRGWGWNTCSNATPDVCKSVNEEIMGAHSDRSHSPPRIFVVTVCYKLLRNTSENQSLFYKHFLAPSLSIGGMLDHIFHISAKLWSFLCPKLEILYESLYTNHFMKWFLYMYILVCMIHACLHVMLLIMSWARGWQTCEVQLWHYHVVWVAIHK